MCELRGWWCLGTYFTPQKGFHKAALHTKNGHEIRLTQVLDENQLWNDSSQNILHGIPDRYL